MVIKRHLEGFCSFEMIAYIFNTYLLDIIYHSGELIPRVGPYSYAAAVRILRCNLLQLGCYMFTSLQL